MRQDVLFPYMVNRSPKLHQMVFITKYFAVLFAESGRTQGDDHCMSLYSSPDVHRLIWQLSENDPPFYSAMIPALGSRPWP